MSKWCKCDILVGSFLVHQFPTYGPTSPIMNFEEVLAGEMLDSGEEDSDVFIWDDSCVQQLVLREDIAEIEVGLTPGMKSFCNAISNSIGRRTWGRGGRRSGGSDLGGGHFGGWLGGVYATDEDTDM